MENKPNEVDAAADLAMLERAKSSVDMDQILDFGPWWYAPLFATMLACLTLFSQPEAGNLSFAYATIGIATAVGLSVHDFRRRKVRQRRSGRSFGYAFAIALGAFLVTAFWGTAVSSIGYESFVPGYAIVGWLITTALLLVLRAVLSVKRLQLAKI